MKVTSYWFCYEWQFRGLCCLICIDAESTLTTSHYLGSGHLDGFIWIDGAPTLTTLSLDNPEDRLVSESYWNHSRLRVDTPVKGLLPPPQHLCQYNVPLQQGLPNHHNSFDLDFSYLSNRVQKHTRGPYCLRSTGRWTEYEILTTSNWAVVA